LKEGLQTCSCHSAGGRTVVFLVIGLALAPHLWAGPKYKVLHAFGKAKDGGGLFASVAFDPKGNLYGTTSGGGQYSSGTVFRLSSNSKGLWLESILHSFCKLPRCTDGSLPMSTPAFDSSGNLYGTTRTVTFQMSPPADPGATWSFRVIFNAGENANLILDHANNLYGTIGGGKYGYGAVTEVFPGSHGWEAKYLYSFCPVYKCADGDAPTQYLNWDLAGSLYGTTTDGGTGQYHLGVAFQLKHTASGWKEHVLHSFPAYQGDGYPQSSGLTVDSHGRLYGTTVRGGSNGCQGTGCGSVFELTRQQDGTWKETILYNFPKLKDGAGPGGGLAMDRAGNLYGTAGGGIGPCGGGCGVVFKMTPNGNGKWTYTVLHRFVGTDGALPVAGPTLDRKGNIYGTTSVGGAYGAGVVYEITP
jgi:uncharacterized repeat protein (TIGR03803 family)